MSRNDFGSLNDDDVATTLFHYHHTDNNAVAESRLLLARGSHDECKLY